uniref:Methyltransferase FkbM domain-containing protein n=1 Tax=Meloidogyne floridensis TaxID=298350 RepID=A0A915NFW8_9BILA
MTRLENEINEMLTQNTYRAKTILNAFKKQKQGLILIRNDNSSKTNYTATLANIPIQFNAIWQEQFNSLNPIGLRGGDEIKYFLKFKNSTSGNYDCNVVTMGVGQHIEAELELKKYYPKCNFLALDPVAEVNADLVEKQLNGTFIERVITAEDSYTANKKANIWNSQGKSQFDGNFDEISIGFFDFFEFYSDKSVIDLLLIDVEGTEFAILQLLAGF